VKNIHEPQDGKGNTLQRCKKTQGKCWQMFCVSQFKTHVIDMLHDSTQHDY
jgi:hypothetical protein